MAAKVAQLRKRTSLGGVMPSLELCFGRNVFAAGGQLSGVVVFRLSKPLSIRALAVTVVGREVVFGSKGQVAPFFSRDVLLTGSDQPRFTSDKISRYWNAFLRRDPCRALSPGEYIYPFSIALPASLPPSYNGKAGRISYCVVARVEFPLKRAVQVSLEAPVACVPRDDDEGPFVLSESEDWGRTHAGDAELSVELASRHLELGRPISGHFTLTNPRRLEIKQAVISLEIAECVRAGAKETARTEVIDSRTVVPADPDAAVLKGVFELNPPEEVSATVDGTSLSVTWFVRVQIDAVPPLEIRVPVTLYTPVN